MPSCREISALVSKGLDMKLNFMERFAVRTHLLICSGCRNFKKQTLLMRVMSRAYLEHLNNISSKRK